MHAVLSFVDWAVAVVARRSAIFLQSETGNVVAWSSARSGAVVICQEPLGSARAGAAPRGFRQSRRSTFAHVSVVSGCSQKRGNGKKSETSVIERVRQHAARNAERSETVFY